MQKIVKAPVDLSMEALLEEEFNAVFGGTTPTAAAWSGLMFS
ncbi:hypothetical protein [Paenarthrobacter sp. NPDC091669]